MEANKAQDFGAGDLVELHLLLGSYSRIVSTGIVLEHARQPHYPFADGLRIHWTDGTTSVQPVEAFSVVVKLKAKA